MDKHIYWYPCKLHAPPDVCRHVPERVLFVHASMHDLAVLNIHSREAPLRSNCCCLRIAPQSLGPDINSVSQGLLGLMPSSLGTAMRTTMPYATVDCRTITVSAPKRLFVVFLQCALGALGGKRLIVRPLPLSIVNNLETGL